MRRIALVALDCIRVGALVAVVVYAALALTHPAPARVALDSYTPVVMHTADASGTDALPPVTRPLWYVTNQAAAGQSAYAEVRDLHERIDRAAAESRPLDVTLHEWADGRAYGAFGGR